MLSTSTADELGQLSVTHGPARTRQRIDPEQSGSQPTQACSTSTSAWVNPEQSICLQTASSSQLARVRPSSPQIVLVTQSATLLFSRATLEHACPLSCLCITHCQVERRISRLVKRKERLARVSWVQSFHPARRLGVRFTQSLSQLGQTATQVIHQPQPTLRRTAGPGCITSHPPWLGRTCSGNYSRPAVHSRHSGTR